MAAQRIIILHIAAYADQDGQSAARRCREPPCATSPFHFPEVSTLDQNALDLIQTDGIVGALIQLGRAGRLVVRDLLRMLNGTTILQIGRNTGDPEGMAAGRGGQSGLPGAPFDPRQHFQPM